jgi:hypothetical protein
MVATVGAPLREVLDAHARDSWIVNAVRSP